MDGIEATQFTDTVWPSATALTQANLARLLKRLRLPIQRVTSAPCDNHPLSSHPSYCFTGFLRISDFYLGFDSQGSKPSVIENA